MGFRRLVEAGFLAHLLYMLPKDLRQLKVEWNSFPPKIVDSNSSLTPKVGLSALEE